MRKGVILPFCLTVMLCDGAFGSSSESYNVTADSIDNGGGQSTGGLYEMTSSIGEIGGLSEFASPTMIARAGYPGQLYNQVSLTVEADPGTVNETSTSQLYAAVILDDGTLLVPSTESIVWSTVSGPVESVSATGLVTTGLVYQNEVATLSGTHGGLSGTGILTVTNVDLDNYGSYGSDGIDDDWQVLYFGEPPNSDASPGSNPDGDANDNEMEFLAGFDPTDPTQWVRVVMHGRSGTTTTISINRVIPGRTYTLQAGNDLNGFPETILSFSPVVEEYGKIIEDSAANDPKKFYRLEITRP